VSPESLQTVSQIAVLVGAVLAALGAFGSAYFGKQADRAKSTRNQAEQAQLHTQIDSLVSGNEKLREQLQPFVEIAKQKFPALGPEEALDKVKESLAQLEKKTDAINQRVQPRQLSDSQIATIAQSLKQAPVAKIHMIRPTGDSEVARFAEQFKISFQKAGWTVEKDVVDLSGAPRFGLVVFASQDPPNASVVALYNALKNVGLEFKLTRDVNLPPDVIGIQVGTKGS